MKMLMVITGDLHVRLGTHGTHPNFIRRTANLEVNEPWFSRVSGTILSTCDQIPKHRLFGSGIVYMYPLVINVAMENDH